MTDDRRRRPRHSVRMVAEVDSVDGGALAVLREISLSGARFLTNRAFEAEDSLDLQILFEPGNDDSKQMVSCSVVRCSKLDADRVGIWNHEVAVHFEEELDHLKDKVEALNETLKSEDWT